MKTDVNWKLHKHDECHESPEMPEVGSCTGRSISKLYFLPGTVQ